MTSFSKKPVPDKIIEQIDGCHDAIGYYADAIRYGDLLFVSGCVPLDANMKFVGAGDAQAQLRQVYRNIQGILDKMGLGFQHVIKETVFLTDMADREYLGSVRKEFHGDHRPASTAVEVTRLALRDQRVEVEAIAYLPDGC
jgi:2-iminobutanoate/2-iminopropanoate deaminase